MSSHYDLTVRVSPPRECPRPEDPSVPCWGGAGLARGAPRVILINL
jgi:hypothetical protein